MLFRSRPRLERELLQVKEARRVAVGPSFTLLFENRATVRWQIQEMCRVEKITDPAAIQHELDTYNGLLPRTDELSATLLVEYDEPSERARMLTALRGLHDHLRLEVDGSAVRTQFDADQYNTDRISSVQFIRFALTSEQADAFCDLRRSAAIVVDHPACAARTELKGAVRGALVEDLLETRG